MSRQLEVELTVTTERAEPEAPKPHTGRRGTQGVCVDKNLPAAHGYLRDLRSGATGTRLGSGCCTAASAGCSPRRATAVVVFSFVSRRPTLSSRGVPRQLIYTGFCARLHATRSEHQSTYCQCHSLWDTSGQLLLGFRVPATRTRSVLSDGRASAQRRRRAQSDT